MINMTKEEQLEKIAKEIENCEVCKVGKSGMAVPGEGNPDADIVFLGEAPGKEEAKSGRPFIGRSGKLLRSLIADAGIKESEFFITSPVKYLPDRGTPSREDINHGRVHLKQQLDIIQPKCIVLLGRVAAEAALEEHVAVMTMHGKIIERDGRKYFLTLHPAAALRNPPSKPLLLGDFKKLKELIQE
jgi:uracil-DNA glycosylase family 4